MKPGDRVVCIRTKSINDNAHTIIKGREYTIEGTYSCLCGKIYLNIGIYFNGPMSGLCNCNNTTPQGIVWANSIHFRPLQYHSAHNELINVVEERLDIKIKEPIKI